MIRHLTDRRRSDRALSLGQLDRVDVVAWAVLALLGFVVLGIFASVLVRPTGSYWTWLDGWVICAVELTASGVCIARALVDRPGRLAALFLGLSLLSWTVGDCILTVQSIGGATPPSPSWSDLFYILFYPFAYAALIFFMRGQTNQFQVTNWLDGAIAGLGVAAACAAVLFIGGFHATGAGSAANLTNLAYPIGDALLLGLIAGGFAALSGRHRAPWILLTIGMALNIFGDSSNLLQHSFGATRIGFILNAIAWPVAITLMSMAVWLRRRPVHQLILEPTANFTLPILGSAAALVLLFGGTLLPIARFSLGLAVTTLVMVGIRLVLSVRSLDSLSQQRQRQALTDELTGLWNRRYLFRALDTFFSEYAVDPSNQSLAFLFIDLDRFKEVNDSFGHPAGDELLRQLGARLQGSLREGDLLVRLGGDEFAVVLAGSGVEYASFVAERLTQSLEEPFELHSVHTTIGASIGIAVAPTDATDSARLVWCADVAMYRAKLGKVPFVCFVQNLDEEHNQMRLAEELHEAIDSGALVLHYQPQLDLRTREILAVEALIRWEHPRLGLVPPDVFLPIALEAGLMTRVTAWVLETAATQCAAWRATGRPFSVAVNITPGNLLEPGFVELVVDTLDRNSLPASALVLEITETSVIEQFETARRVIEDLRDLGIIVSIDDFGAGVTSLAYLGDLAVRELKLDRSFIERITNDTGQRDLDLVRSTIELGHAMGLRIVAEGIEDAQTLELLADCGCDIAQGYCISRPQPADAFSFRAAPSSGLTARQP
jgi:diguanylate cyclase (GGDEF)-like protein